MRSLSRDEVRAVDRHAIEQWQVPGVVLMENAGRGAADILARQFLPIANRSVAIVAGRGNNAGDGFVIARHLHRMGAECKVYLTSPPDQISGDAALNLRIIQAIGLDVREAGEQDMGNLADWLSDANVIVDALGGTGIEGTLRGRLAEAVMQINIAGQSVTVLSVDIPTGLDCDTGTAAGPAVRARMTVTFVARKKGFDNPDSGNYTGEVIVQDIGIDAARALEQAGAQH